MRRSLLSYLTGLTILLLLPASSLLAQTSTLSPYSRFGVGDLLFSGTSFQKGMGGVSIGMQSENHLNFNNPASYSNDTLTILEFGVDAEYLKLSQEGRTSKLKNSNLNSFALGFPLIKHKMGMSFGFIPYAGTGYEVRTSAVLDSVTKYNAQYSGTGGFTRYFIGTGLNLGKHFAAGLNASYLFGTTDNTRRVEYTTTNMINNKYVDELTLSSFYFEFGLNWKYDTGNKYRNKIKYVVGLTGAPAQSINAKRSELWENYTTRGSILEYIKDTVLYTSDVRGDVVLPARIGLGFSISSDDKWVVGGDFNYQDWSSYKSYGQQDSLKNSYRISLGTQLTPDSKSFTYFKRVSYRFGAYFGQTYLNLNNTKILDFGLSTGVSFPMRKSNQSMISFAFEAGQRGTTDNKLLKEQYLRLSIGLTFNEAWFKKQKFD